VTLDLGGTVVKL